jgi:hypothetical protein
MTLVAISTVVGSKYQERPRSIPDLKKKGTPM